MTASLWYYLNLLCILIAAGVFLDVYRNESTGFRSPMLLLLACCIFALGTTLMGYHALSLHEMRSLSRLTVLAENQACLFCTLFICQFFGRKLSSRLLLSLTLGAVAAAVLVLAADDYGFGISDYAFLDSTFIPGKYVIASSGGPARLFIDLFLLTNISLALSVIRERYKRSIAAENKDSAALCRNIAASQLFPLFFALLSGSGAVTDNMIPLGIFLDVLAMYILISRYGVYDIVRTAKDTVLDTVAEAVIVLDKDMHTVYTNQAANALLSYMLPGQLVMWLQSKAAQIGPEKTNKLNIAGSTYSARLQTITHNQADIGCFITLVDITEEAARAEQLKQLKDKAEQANRAKSVFLATMSHEIRTPMNSIVGITEILLRDHLTSQQKEYLGNIRTAGSSLLSIINEILDFSKVESGKMALINSEYEPLSLLNDMNMILLNRIGEKPLELQYVVDKNLPRELIGDCVRIRQILINLTNNAIKFTDWGHVRLSIDIKKTGRDTVDLTATIADTGQGISQENLSRLFSDFQQVDQLKNRNKEGTGLGLSLSKKLVELMGGTIGVRSKLGSGSEFYFTIPQKVSDPAPAAQLKESVMADVPSVGALFQSAEALQLLQNMAEDFGVPYREVQGLSLADSWPDYVFVDNDTYQSRTRFCHDLLTRTRLAVVQNAMAGGSISDPEAIVVSQPLYSLNFCQVLNGEKSLAAGEETAVDRFCSFVAPEARILIVDDNEMNLKVSTGLMKPLEMEIFTACSGPEAIRMVELMEPFDIIFMDHMMPGMDGCEATALIRGHEGDYFKNVPIIALTANVFADSQAAFREAGMVDFVAKPIDSKELTAILRKWLPPEKLIRPARKTPDAANDASAPAEKDPAGGQAYIRIDSPRQSLPKGGELPVAAENPRPEQDGAGCGFGFTAPEARILIVDDNAMNITVTSRLLEPLEMKIYTANSGPEAIQMVESAAEAGEPFDLIFMDYMMPGMDGCETTVNIRGHEGDYFKRVPIVTLTANDFGDNREAFKKAGMVDFVAKPIVDEEITVVLRRWLPPEKILCPPRKTEPVSLSPDSPGTANRQTKSPDDSQPQLPEIQGIDNAIGVKNCGSVENFRELLEDFVKAAEVKCEEIENLMNAGDVTGYTIEVHAQKSIARLIGAMELGEKFFAMEKAGKNFQLDLIREKTPELLAEFYDYKERIAATLQKKDEAPKISLDNDTIRNLLNTLNSAIKELDIARMDDAMTQLAGASLPEDWSKDIARLEAYVTNMDDSGAARVIDSLLEKLTD